VVRQSAAGLGRSGWQDETARSRRRLGGAWWSPLLDRGQRRQLERHYPAGWRGNGEHLFSRLFQRVDSHQSRRTSLGANQIRTCFHHRRGSDLVANDDPFTAEGLRVFHSGGILSQRQCRHRHVRGSSPWLDERLLRWRNHEQLGQFPAADFRRGRTWKRAAGAPELRNPQMLLVTSSEGWLYGVDLYGGPCLYVTRDGARSWQEVAPEVHGSDESVVIGLPTFEDAKHGFLQVNGVDLGNPKYLTMALMATSDGGRTWKPDRTVADLDDIARMQYMSSTVVGSHWIFAAASEHHPVFTKLGPGARIDASADAATSVSHYKVARQLSFATPTQAWAIVGDGYLMSTTDGGATWTTLLPGPQPHVIQPHGSFIPRQ
jgi:hypothetical protein